MPGETIAQGLSFSVEGRDMTVHSDDVWPSLTLRFRNSDGRVQTAALMLDGSHATDLSGNPGAVVTMLRERPSPPAPTRTRGAHGPRQQ